MKNFFLVLCLISIAGFAFASGDGEKKGDGSGERKFVQIKSSSIGGSWYAAGAVWAKLISENSDYIAMNSASPGYTNESVTRMLQGKAQLACADGIAAYPAYKGWNSWAEPVEVRALFNLWPGVYDIVVMADSKYKTLADLKGAKIATYAEGEPTGVAFLDLMEWSGVTSDNTTIFRVTKKDATRMFIDGSADCLVYAFGHGHANLKEITSSRDVRFIHVSPENEERFMKEYPYFTTTTFGSEFGVADETQFSSPYFTIALADMSDEDAYLFTKIWWENWDFLEDAIPAYVKWIDKTNVAAGIPIPFHPGAIKYYKEQGMWKE